MIAGVWLIAPEIPRLGFRRLRIIVSGTLLTVAGVLLIVALHWGNFG